MTHTTEDLLAIIDKQRAFFAAGKTASLTFRQTQLMQLKKMLQENEDLLTQALQADLGKAPLESYFTEIGLTYNSINHMLKHLKKYMQPQRVKTPLFLFPAKSYLLSEPLGNSLIMSAFNYPILLALDPLVGAIAGGNTALIALSEYTPQINHALFKLVPKYFEPDYIYFFESSIATNTEVLKQKFDKIFFTGSPKVGKIVYQAASQHLTPVTLELGGKSPALVTEKADLAHAAKRIAWGKFINTGQTCVAPDYCLVAKEISEEFLENLQKELTVLYGEDPSQSPDYGRLVNQAAFKRLSEQLTTDEAFIYAGGQTNKATRYIAPTILLANSVTNLLTMQEEIFGPILPVITYDSLDSAVTYIQSQPKPLAFYPFTQDKVEQKYLTQTISYGGCTVNDTILHLANHHLPFGGVGNSGMGQYHGKYSFETFTHQKAVLKRQTWLSLPVMNAPYDQFKEKIIKMLLK